MGEPPAGSGALEAAPPRSGGQVSRRRLVQPGRHCRYLHQPPKGEPLTCKICVGVGERLLGSSQQRRLHGYNAEQSLGFRD